MLHFGGGVGSLEWFFLYVELKALQISGFHPINLIDSLKNLDPDDQVANPSIT